MAPYLPQSARKTLRFLGGGVAALALACAGSNTANTDMGNPDFGSSSSMLSITSLQPAKASTAGGTSVTITGTKFESGATVKLVSLGGTVTVSSATVSADGTSITFMTPPNGGKPGQYDVVVSNPDGSTASLPKGFRYFLGTVSFALAQNIAGNANDKGPRSVVAADMNKDGNLDVVVAYANSNTVAVFLGDGTGKFNGTTTNMGVGTYPYSVTVGDVNGDKALPYSSAGMRRKRRLYPLRSDITANKSWGTIGRRTTA